MDVDVQGAALDKLIGLIRSQVGDNPEPGDHVVRCAPGQIPFRLPANMRRAPAKPEAPPEGEQARAVPALDREADTDDGAFVIEGVASSTSVDWYGTEMSMAALDDMASQFSAGVDLFPRHGGILDHVEWDEVIGRTIVGAVQRADVANPADLDESGFILSFQGRIERDAPRAAELERRLDSGQPIGTSIGGWFLEVRFISDDDGEISRVIIEKVLLDHLAIVRSPANPDAVGLKVLREAARATMQRATPSPAMPEGDPEVRTRDGVTAPTGLDDDTSAGHDGSRDHHDDRVLPEESRSNNMDKLDQILSTLGEIKAGQERNSERLTDLERAREQEQEAREAREREAAEQRAAETPELEAAEQRAATFDPEAQAEAIVRAVTKALGERDAKAEDKPADSPEVVELRNRITALEAERANRDAALADLVFSGRVGRGASTGGIPTPATVDDSRAMIDSMVQRCKEQGDAAPVLCAIVERAKDDLALTRERSGHLPRGERGKQYLQAAHNAEHTLRSLLVAAERDALIGDFDRGWVS